MFFKTKTRTWQSQKATIQRTAGFSLCDKKSHKSQKSKVVTHGMGEVFFFLAFSSRDYPGRFLVEGGFCFTFRSWWWGRRQIIRNPNGGTRARVTLVIGVLLRLRRPRELGQRAPLWTLRRRGSWAIDPAARKKGHLRAPPALHMLSCPDLPRP